MAARVQALCTTRTLIVARYGPAYHGPCMYFGQAELARSGALAVYSDGEGLLVVAARDASRQRLWNGSGVGLPKLQEPQVARD